jgi:hypothetical protein
MVLTIVAYKVVGFFYCPTFNEYKIVNTTFQKLYLVFILRYVGTAVAQWLRYCATNRKVTGSIPDGVTGIYH